MTWHTGPIGLNGTGDLRFHEPDGVIVLDTFTISGRASWISCLVPGLDFAPNFPALTKRPHTEPVLS
ncbi:MAG: hypothetical protein Roseis2KO_39520 [Roseivirga sp.]